MAAYVCLINEDYYDHVVITLAVLASSLRAQLLMYTVDMEVLESHTFMSKST